MRLLFTLVLLLTSSYYMLGQVSFGALGSNPRLQNLEQEVDALEEIFVATGQQYLLSPKELHPSAVGIELDVLQRQSGFQFATKRQGLELKAPEKALREQISFILTLEDGRRKKITKSLVAIETLQLPFTEEFSYASDVQLYPDGDKWMDRDVYVNVHLPYHPPSLGVATLDGTDENGEPYGKRGSSDTLTSAFIDLSPYRSDDTIYFSFTYQPGGLSVAPRKDDILVLEFKNADQEWEQVFKDEPEYFYPDETPPEFSYREIALTDERYLHNNFQFRFRNFSDGTGLRSVWHLDYIRIEENFDPSPKFRLLTNDVALGHPPYTLFRGATAMPLKQFLADVEGSLLDTLRVDVYSHYNDPESFASNRWSVVNLLTGDSLATSKILLNPDPIELQQPPPGQYVMTAAPLPPQQQSDLDDNFSSKLTGEERTILKVHFDLNSSDDIIRDGYQNNDEASTILYLSDFFAYDDGSADMQLSLSGDAGRIAVEFELLAEEAVKGMLLAFLVVAESDQGKQFRYELRSGSPNGTVLLREDNAEVDYPSGDLRFPQFAYYEFPELEEGIVLEPGKYYLIIRSKNNSTINIGYDRQFDMGNSRFYQYDRDSSKYVLSNSRQYSVPGVPMVRLVTTDFERTAIEESNSVGQNWTIYPNPTSEYLMIKGLESPAQYYIYNASGQILQSGNGLKNRLKVNNFPPGSYLLIFEHGGQWQQIKFIIQRP